MIKKNANYYCNKTIFDVFKLLKTLCNLLQAFFKLFRLCPLTVSGLLMWFPSVRHQRSGDGVT